LAGPGRRSLAAVSVPGRCVLFPARFVAGAVVAAPRMAVARSQRLAAL